MHRSSIPTILIVIFTLTGCAHIINITPPLNTISGEGISKSDKTVGYYIPSELRSLKVTTPGGGGDKVSYFPYADSEPALNQMLSNLYTNVVLLSAPNDKNELVSKKIAYIFTTTVTTASSSNSAFTWPPTNFTVTLQCSVNDANGSPLWNGTVTGTGDATFADFKHDFSLAARRASKDAFNKLQNTILNTKELK